MQVRHETPHPAKFCQHPVPSRSNNARNSNPTQTKRSRVQLDSSHLCRDSLQFRPLFFLLGRIFLERISFALTSQATFALTFRIDFRAPVLYKRNSPSSLYSSIYSTTRVLLSDAIFASPSNGTHLENLTSGRKLEGNSGQPLPGRSLFHKSFGAQRIPSRHLLLLRRLAASKLRT